MHKKQAYFFLLIACFPVSAFCATEKKQAEPESELEQKVYTSEGLHFKMPVDWPIEKRGGVLLPIPIEEYIALKFKKIEARLRVLESQSAVKEEDAEEIEQKPVVSNGNYFRSYEKKQETFENNSEGGDRVPEKSF